MGHKCAFIARMTCSYFYKYSAYCYCNSSIISRNSVFYKINKNTTCFQKLKKLIQDRLALTNEVADEVFSSMQTIRSFANEPGELDRYNSRLQDVYGLLFKQATAWTVYRSLTSVSK